MKKSFKYVLYSLLVLCVVATLVFVFMAKGNNNVEILLLGTSDVHGQLFATDYTKDESMSGEYDRGLTRISTYVKEQRSKYKNVFLTDAGDTTQGSPLTYYQAFYNEDAPSPAVKALRTMDYDLWVAGNHEFNYGMDTLKRQLEYATSEATDGESQLEVSMANYLDASTNNNESKDWNTWRGYDPYRVYEYDGVKVAVMGIGNPNIPEWEVPANWEGIYFANPVDTYLHYEKEMDEASDIIVLVSHSGIDSKSASDYVRRLVEQTNTVDVAIAGHEHLNGVTEISNTDGKLVPVISPFTKCQVIGRALITFNKSTKECTVAAEDVNMNGYRPDGELVNTLQPYEDATWNEYLKQTVGSASGDFTTSKLATAPSSIMDLINRVMIWGAYDRTGLNTPNDNSDDIPAQLSLSAPLTAGDETNIIPKGDITMADIFRLYPYDNWFYQINMSGKELRTWLEFSASKLGYDESGQIVANDYLTNYDVVYGDGFSYEIDLKTDPGTRISSMTYNGKEVADEENFTVVLNNFRFNGGIGYIKYLNEHGCSFTPNDEQRVVYSTQYDMIQGEDLGQARNLLAEYIRQAGTIDPIITSTWSIH